MMNINNKRRFFRIKLDTPLCAEVSIAQINKKRVNTGAATVCINDIGPSGLCFTSELIFPINPGVILSFKIQILDHVIKLPGRIVRRKTINKESFEYGIDFVAIDENMRSSLVKLFNIFNIRINKNVILQNHNYINIPEAEPVRPHVKSTRKNSIIKYLG